MGSKIREARHRAGQRITQEQLAARLQSIGVDMDRTAISKIEGGSRRVSDVELVAISSVLSMEIADLIGTGENEN